MKHKFLKNPIKWYKSQITDSIIPNDLTHRVRMNVDIKKGKKSGRALIPCAIYSFDHSIDLNPALIRRKDKKKIKYLPVNKNHSYDSKKYEMQLTENEKKLGYELDELEKCKHCNQRLVIAQVSETRYRSCPDVNIRLSDKAKENLTIPVDFGINKTDVNGIIVFAFFIDLVLLFFLLSFVETYFGFHVTDNINSFMDAQISNISNSFLIILVIPFVLYVLIFVSLIVLKVNYKAYRLWKWWLEVKHTLTKVRVA